MSPETEEMLLDMIDDLKNDLKVRDDEYEQMRIKMEKLEA